MSYGQWKIEEEITFQEFGYLPKNLSPHSHKPVKVICTECGTLTNKRLREANRKHRCKSIINGQKKCFKCKTRKYVEEFSKNRSRPDGYQKVCKECFASYKSVQNGYRRKSKLVKTDKRIRLKNRLSGIKSRAKRINVPFDLDVDFLLNLLEKQKYRCYYSGIEMKFHNGISQYDSVSLERKIPELGYIKENVVFCAYCINSLKGGMTETKFHEFIVEVGPKLIANAKAKTKEEHEQYYKKKTNHHN